MPFPIGIYSAVRQYSVGDYVATFFGFIGLAIPNFLLALVLMYVGFRYFGQSVGGLFSPEYIERALELGQVPRPPGAPLVPIIVLGTARTAALIRIMRANLLDELHKPYVDTARAKRPQRRRLLLKYPVRVALNPFVSTHRLGAAGAGLGRGHRLGRAEPADHRAAAAQRAAQPGHVPRRQLHPHASVPDGRSAR